MSDQLKEEAIEIKTQSSKNTLTSNNSWNKKV